MQWVCNLRQEVARLKLENVELGPDDAHMLITDDELTTYNQKEVARLKDALAKSEAELEGLKISKGADPKSLAPGSKWNTLRTHLREFTLNTQQQLEAERAELLTENLMIKEQLKESQEYIDIHLVKYKEEITRLRRMLGMDPGNISRLSRR